MQVLERDEDGNPTSVLLSSTESDVIWEAQQLIRRDNWHVDHVVPFFMHHMRYYNLFYHEEGQEFEAYLRKELTKFMESIQND